MAYGGAMQPSEWAERQARTLLSPKGPRWAHTEAVAAVARSVALALGEEDGDVLVAAAYLHDIGYAPELAVTGFHPLDGARYLLDLVQERLAGLVAHHTGADHEARLRGHQGVLAEFPNEGSPVTAALAYCDLITGPDGRRVTPEERLRDVEARYGADSPVVQGLRAAWPELLTLVAQTEALLAADATSDQRPQPV